MSDPTAPVEGTSTSTPAPEAAPASTVDPLSDRLTELASGIGDLTSRFSQFEERLPQPEPVAEPDPWADLFGTQDQDQDPYGQQPQQQGLDPQALQAAIQAAIQQNNAPLLQKLQNFELREAATRLGEMVPALRDTPENAQNRQQAFQIVSTALQGYPQEIAQQLMADPNFIATHWKAAEADRLSAGQAPAGGPAPTLETAGGALPGGPTEQTIDQAFPAQQKALARGFY